MGGYGKMAKKGQKAAYCTPLGSLEMKTLFHQRLYDKTKGSVN